MSNTAATGVIVGVGTHKDAHAAVAVDAVGARLGAETVPATAEGHRALRAWALDLVPVRASGVEGTGSCGAGLSRFLCGRGHAVLEVDRPDRQLRHREGKSGTADAEGAARAVLSGQATALPKSGTGEVEMTRHLKVARDAAPKARTQAMPALKATIVGAPAALREQLDLERAKMALTRRCAGLRPGPIASTTAPARAVLRATARRRPDPDAETRSRDTPLEAPTAACAPELIQAHGMAAGTAAETLLPVGGNPGRIRSEAAFAEPCGACPVPASSGRTSRHRLNRGGNRQANAALHRVVVTRMRGHRPTLDHVHRRMAEGKGEAEIIRRLKRFVARGIYGHLCRRQGPSSAGSCSA